MAEAHLSNDEFFSKLATLFNSNQKRSHGSIHLIQKRLTYGNEDALSATASSENTSFPELAPSRPLPVLVRATDGKSKEKRASKTKLSTVVDSDALEEFYAKYAEVCKAGMGALKKRDRSKRKQKEKARKKNQGAEPKA